MRDKAEDKQNQMLTNAMKDLQAPLDVLAMFKLADEFYPKDKRSELYAEYQRLQEADDAAFVHMQEQLGSPSGMTFEERVARHGQEVAAAHVESCRIAREARIKTMNAVDAFRKEHGLLMRLLGAKAAYGKTKYD
ncbi:hypothetical protein ACOTDN_15690 [Achromobacter xylosoxidans]